ncbi:MAG: redox-regulated ATPase YchF [Chloroflexota bacterium]
MQIGIAGLPGSGKTTLFNALAHQHALVGGYAGVEPNLAVVKVPDERLDRLSALFQPKKHTPAEVRFIDVAGLARGMGHESSAAVLANLRTVDVLLQVVGAFQSERNPRSDFEEFSLELQLADLEQIQKRVDRLEKELRLGSKGTPGERAAKERELAVLERLQPVLEAGEPVRSLEFSADEHKAISSFGFLTQKPTLVVLNLADEQDAAELLAEFRELTHPVPHTAVLGLPGKLEMELGELSPEDAAEFMQALNVSGSQLGEVTSTAYALAELVSFFTAGDDECRAWTIGSGTSAQDAAGSIHSDLARGFIRAEVIRWDQLLEAGSEAAAKKRGWVRQEGKVYLVQDGDVLHVLFNV